MLVTTSGLGWVWLFNPLWFIVPVVIFIVLVVLEVRTNSYSSEMGPFGGLSIVTLVAGIVSALMYLMLSYGPHIGTLREDITDSTGLSEVTWSNYPRFTAMNEDGAYVKCTFFETERKTLIQIVCDK